MIGINIFVGSGYAFNKGLIRGDNMVQLITTLGYIQNYSTKPFN